MAAFKLNLQDMLFILRQIKIAEGNSTAHSGANALDLRAIYVDVNGNVVPAGTPGAQLAIPDPHVPNGLRTVDGTYNNIVPGRETWGSADQAMPRLLDASFRDDQDGDTMNLGPGGVVTNTNYGASGNVADADPRIISNLIVDMSISNPAAVEAWFNNELAVSAWEEAHFGMTPIRPGTLPGPNELVITNEDLKLIPNIAPDEGLSAPFNAWMTFFGQFFDHGLDLISKGGGTVFVPLQADDPLVLGPNGVVGGGDDLPPHLRFMVLTRASADPDGSDSQVNTTTPFVDQNQTYTSHASHQVFLREYTRVGNGPPMATGRLLDGSANGLPTWADIKAQAANVLGILLTDGDVLNIPLLRTDAYGEFIRGPNGFPQIVVGLGSDNIPNTADDIVVEGNPGSPVNTFTATAGGFTGAVRIGHAFLDDIAHNANPFNSQTATLKAADGDGVINGDTNGNGIIDGTEVAASPSAYDDELLARHFITGDGRGNENIGLTTVHHIFHSEHNRQTDMQKMTILQSGDLAFINEWLAVDIDQARFDTLPATFPADPVAREAFLASFTWDGERIFQAARFATEMQYQHLVFEEFARKIQPAIDVFVFNSVTDINPAIFSEFANTVYRFGHSMLSDAMPRIDENGDVIRPDVGLVEAFLNPVEFDLDGAMTHDAAAAAIVRGMTIEHGNEIDEFVVGSLRNNLLGLPLDLAAINIARGRDTGIPSLNDARAQLYAATGSTFLKPYDHWVDLAANLKNPASVINFIAAYGTHATIEAETTLAGKRAAAQAIVMGQTVTVTIGNVVRTFQPPADRIEFLTGTDDPSVLNTSWAGVETGLNLIDLWIGGLAEKKMPFGGMLGSTFNAIFEAQLENLQDGDRFYYLTRTQGQNFLNQLEQNSFSKMMMANTDLAQPGADGIRGTADDIITRHIGVDSFAKYDFVLEVNQANQAGDDPTGNDPVLEAMGLGKVIRNNPGTVGADANYLRFTGGEHIVVGGTNGNDTIITDFGDDAIWADDGNDRVESGAGVDLVNGGGGDDILTDSGDTGDFIKGEEGNDVIANSNGIDILMGGDGKDVIFVGVDDTEVFAGAGDDFVAGGEGVDLLMGNEGDDWLEGAGGFDTIAGDNSELFFNSAIKGHDVMFAGNEEMDFDGESGDDIMVQGESVMRNEGMFGFDWAIFKGMALPGYADMRIPIFTTEAEDILRNRFDKVEALSGWMHNDTLIGDERVFGEVGPDATVATTENIFFNDGLDQAGIDRIVGLNQIVGVGPTGFFESGNILLGGAGSDLIQGNGGDDIIDGDRWLNVRIRITGTGQTNTQGNQLATVDSLRHVFTLAELGNNATTAGWVGKSLSDLMISGTIKPDQLHVVREVLDGEPGPTQSIDTAVFRGNRDQYEVVTSGGLTTVRHLVDPVTGVSDGVDTLRNIERLQFADETVELVPGLNALPAGQPVIDGLAQVGQLLTLRLNPNGSVFGVTDADNVSPANTSGAIFSPLIIEWQIETDPGVFVDTGFRGVSFTPSTEGEFEVGADIRVRAIVRYTDGDGIPSSVSSLPTEPLVPASNDVATEGDDVLVGTPQSDELDGLGGNDVIFGLASADELIGGTGDDEIFGGAGDDTLAGGDGNDILDGGAGQDTAVFSGARQNYTFEFNAEGQLEVVSTLVPEEDAVIGIEAFRFDDVTVTLAQALAGLPTPPTEGNDTIAGTAGDDDIDGLGGNDTINALGGDDTIVGGLGNDTIDAGAGDDVILWEVGEGRDIVQGGAGTDRLRLRGSGEDETFFIETRADYLTRTGSAPGSLQAATDMVISRRVGAGPSTVIAELDGIDEIDVNGGGGNDTFVVSGDFAGTDLDPSTITIDGTAGDDTIDITALDSQHRIVFRSNGGDDRIIGTLRPQDVVELTPGTVLSGYTLSDNANGSKTLSNGTHSITFTGTVPPQFVPADDDDDDDGTTPLPVAARTLIGTAAGEALVGAAGNDMVLAGGGGDILSGEAGDDILRGEDGDDIVSGGNGADVMSGGAGVDELHGGAGADFLFGEAGNDRLFGDAGDDVIEGGAGADQVWAGDGNDVVLAAKDDGDDTYWGGNGVDTLDYAAATANLTVDLGNGFMGRGSVSGGSTGSDIHYGFENVIGGAGHDVITASAVANIIDGGLGEDTFRFASAANANGDRIYGFTPGDKIDFSAIDANTGASGVQHFTLKAGAITAAGDIVATHEVIDGEAFTVLRGNIDGDPDADFELLISGTHNLRAADFNGVS